MAQPYIGEIRLFAGTFAPQGWARCDGQLLPISEYDALFTLFGTTYGGDGQNTFGLPDLRGRIPVHAGAGPGLSPRQLSEKAGVENVTLLPTQLPSHAHEIRASVRTGTSADPAGRMPAVLADGTNAYGQGAPVAFDAGLDAGALAAAGGSQPHTNVMPYLCVTFIVSLFGIYPSQF